MGERLYKPTCTMTSRAKTDVLRFLELTEHGKSEPAYLLLGRNSNSSLSFLNYKFRYDVTLECWHKLCPVKLNDEVMFDFQILGQNMA